MKNKNCPNCAAPYDPNLIKCPYCGTIYFDFPALDVDNHTPVWLRFKKNNNLILQKAYLSSASLNVSTDEEYIYKGNNAVLALNRRSVVNTTLEFEGCDGFTVIDMEGVDGDSN